MLEYQLDIPVLRNSCVKRKSGERIPEIRLGKVTKYFWTCPHCNLNNERHFLSDDVAGKEIHCASCAGAVRSV